MMRFDYAVRRLPLARPFAISRGVRTDVEVVEVTLDDGQYRALGEGTPTPRYGQTTEVVIADLERLSSCIDDGIDRITLAERMPAGVARNALDSALWSLEAQRRGVDLETLVAEALAETPRSRGALVSVQTVGIATPEAMAEAAYAEWEKGARQLKIKLDGEQIEARMHAIRERVPEAELVVDANEAFAPDDLPATCRLLASLGVTMVEQPLRAGEDSPLATFPHPLPVCADESCHTRSDLAALVGRYDMINIKLDKCGGLTEGLAMLTEARRLGLKVMIGCMLGSSTAMRAALPLAVRAELVDLDGPTWLAKDPSPFPMRFVSGEIKA